MIFVGIFLFHSTKKIHNGTLLCFIYFLVSKQLMDKGGWGDHDSPSEIYCLTVPKKIVQQSFSVSLIRVSKIFLHWKDNHEFLSKVFVSQRRK